MKKTVIALRRHTGKITAFGIPAELNLPDGCNGVLFCFESKKKAMEYWGKDTQLLADRAPKQIKRDG